MKAAVDPGSQAVMARLADRVRQARQARDMPRRTLSERSGVSPRYLAQLEAGKGNISVVLLHKVAQALEVPMALLLVDDTPLDPDLSGVIALYQQAPPELRNTVRKALRSQQSRKSKAGRIALIGLRGAGKSTLGKAAATALGLPFVELNAEIERSTGMPIGEVLALYGADHFRALEAQALAEAMQNHDRMILAAAGGVVSNEVTFARLQTQFHTIWLRASPGEHMERVRAQGDLRPMAGNPEAMVQLKALLEERAPYYQRAEFQVDTTGKPENSSLNEVLAVIANQGLLDGEM